MVVDTKETPELDESKYDFKLEGTCAQMAEEWVWIYNFCMLKVKSLQNLYHNVDIILLFSLKYTYNMYIDILIPCTQTK